MKDLLVELDLPATEDTAALANRLSTAVARAVRSLPWSPSAVKRAMRSDDLSALSLVLLSTLEGSDLAADSHSRMAIKGAVRFNALVAESGGAFSIRDVSDLLSRSTGSIQKSVERNQLLAFKHGGEWLFPVAQFDLERGDPVSGLRELLAAFPDHTDPKSKVIFCLSGFESTQKTPLSLLKDGIDSAVVVSSAKQYLEHGA